MTFIKFPFFYVLFEHFQQTKVLDVVKYAYYPIYVDCYEKCIRNIFTDLIRREDEKENCSDKFGYVCRDNASSIEAFLGARGTGKSTAMVEFCNILEQLNNRETREWWLEQSIKDNAILDRVKSR